MLAGAALLLSRAEGTGANAPVPSVLTEGRYTFAELGWADDQVLNNEDDRPSVTFRLPEGIRQGEPLWYGIRLAYEWKGEMNPGEFAFFYARWNGKALYQFKSQWEEWAPGNGQEWSMVDFIAGESRAYEVTGEVRAASSNVATIPGVGAGGETVLDFQIDETFAPTGRFQLRIKKESEVFVTRWQPPGFDADVSASLKDGKLTVHAAARNSGWETPSSSLGVMLVFPDGSRRELSGKDRGPVAPLGKLDIVERFDLEQEPESVFALLSWGLGSDAYAVAMGEQGGWPDLDWLLIGGYWGALAAFIIAWVAFSTALRAKGSLELRWSVPGRLRWRTAMFVAAVFGAAGAGAFFLLDRGRDGFGAYPFPLERELPNLTEEDRLAGIGILEADARVQSAAAGQAWEYPQILVATERGTPIGVYAFLFFKDGIRGSGTWPALVCDGSRVAEVTGPDEEVPGLAAVVDFRTGRVVELLPLTGTPGTGRAIDFRAPACPP